MAFGSSNVMEVTCQSLTINYCNFTGNTPFSNNWRSFGGALFAKLSQILITNTCFIQNINYNGAAIYLEQHEKYTLLSGSLTNIIALNNFAYQESGFCYFSSGLLSFNVLVENCIFEGNYAVGGIN